MKGSCKSFFGVATFMLVVSSAESVANAETYKCQPTEKHYCEADKGCTQIPAKTWAKVDTVNGTYSRCDRIGCDDYDAHFAKSGKFISITVPGRGLIAQMSVDGSQFTEVATLAGAVYTSFGACKTEDE